MSTASNNSSNGIQLTQLAERVCAMAQKHGADHAAASASAGRSYKIAIRDGEVEELKASVSSGLSVRLYVDGRYGAHWTSEIDDGHLDAFVKRAIDMTRILAPDPHRALPDPALYADRPTMDLGAYDPDWPTSDAMARRQRAMAAYEAAAAEVGDKGISIAATASDSVGQSALVTTNGFADSEQSTGFWVSASATVQDPSGRKPSDWSVDGARRVSDPLDPAAVGRVAAQRALAQIGADDIPSTTLPIIVENRAVSKLLGGFLRPLSGALIDQKRSVLEHKIGQSIATDKLTLIDDPFMPGAWGSTRFDSEGLTVRRRPIVDKGVLQLALISTYYARKLDRPVTGAEITNLVFDNGQGTLEDLMREAGDALLITGFLGGNTNPTTGDFSHGVQGFLVKDGKRAQPIAGMNLAGNHTQLWHTLQSIGADTYTLSATRTPSLLFGPTVIAGK